MSTTAHSPSPVDIPPIPTLQQIDSEISQLEERIVTLKITRNTLIPISQLHPEILQEIFVLSSLLCKDTHQIGKTALLLTWVCHTWRDLTHQTSELWSYIDFTHPMWIETALARTRNRSLDFDFVFMPKYRGSSECLAELSLGNLPRVKTLSVQSSLINAPTVFPQMSPLWCTPAPVLVELNLHSVYLPPNLFAGIFPSLRILSLDECGFQWESLPIHTKIQKLAISSPVVHVSVEDLMRKLQLISREVEDLSLEDTLLPHSPSPYVFHTRQRLEKIKKLRIQGEDALPLTFVFNQLWVPPSCDTSVSVWNDGTVKQFPMVEAFVACRGLSKWRAISMEIEVHDHLLVIVITEESTTVSKNRTPTIEEPHPGLSEFAEPSSSSSSHPRPDFSSPDSSSSSSPSDDDDDDSDDTIHTDGARLHFAFNFFDGLHTLLPIINIFPLSPITTLTLSGEGHNDDHSAFSDFFFPLQLGDGPGIGTGNMHMGANTATATQESVESINVMVFFVPTFSKIICQQNERLREVLGRDNANVDNHNHNNLVLETLTPESKSQYAHILGFPHLRTITYYGAGDYDESFFIDWYYTILRDWLMWRRAVGIGVDTLVFKNMTVSSEYFLMGLYEGVVDTFECVGVREAVGSDYDSDVDGY